MSKLEVVYIVSNVSKAVAFEWISEKLPKEGIQLSFILLGSQKNTPLCDFLSSKHIPYDFIDLGSKWTWPAVFFKTYTLLKKIRPTHVHTHLFEASLLGLMAAKLAGVKSRIYTRHHSTYHHEFFPKAVKYDKLINSLCTKVVAISPNVKNVLEKREGVAAHKIKMIPHGFDLDKFSHPDESAVKELNLKYNENAKSPVIGCISRYVEWKGVDYIVRAFKKVVAESPNALLLIFNAGGPFEAVIKEELSQMPPESFREIRFENDLFSIYQLMDVYVHTPLNPEIEAFGQTYVESLASGIPSVFTLSGIAPTFIVNEENALVVDYKKDDQIYRAIQRILANPSLQEKLSKQGKSSVSNFSLPIFIKALATLYKE